MVIFAGGKFRENVDKTFHVGVIFTILLILLSHLGFIFARGKFSRKRRYCEKRKNFPHAKISNFTVMSLYTKRQNSTNENNSMTIWNNMSKAYLEGD